MIYLIYKMLKRIKYIEGPSLFFNSVHVLILGLISNSLKWSSLDFEFEFIKYICIYIH